MKANIPFHPILMHFAARYSGRTYSEFASDHRTLVNCNIKCYEDFELDAVSLISDPYRETSAFGGKISYPEDAVPQCRELVIKSNKDIQDLKRPDLYKDERTLDRIQGAILYRKLLGTNVPLIGWIEGPLAESCDLAGVNQTLLNLMMDPDSVKLLIDKVTQTAKDFAKAQIEAGCNIIGMGDAICSQISADQYREFIRERHIEIVEFIHDLGAQVKIHICGNITHLLPDLKMVNPDILDLDWMVDLEQAHHILGNEITRCGNLDPVAVIQNQSYHEVSAASQRLVQQEKGRAFILSGGCEVTAATSPEKLMAMRRASQC